MEPSKAALRFRNIAAYWRDRAAKSQNPEPRPRLNPTAAHYDGLARGTRSRDEPVHCGFGYASRQQLLLITAGAMVDETIYLDVYDATVRFIASRGPCSMIL